MPGIVITVSGDSSKFKNELAQVEKIAKGMGGKLKESFDGGHGGVKGGVLREAMVMVRELARGDFSRLTSSAAVFADRAGILPKIFAALVSPIGLVAVAATAGGVAIYKIGQHVTDILTKFHNLNLESTRFANQLGKINAPLNIQKGINEVIGDAVDKYDSASESAERARKSSEAYFNHLERMNENEIDPVKKQKTSLAILEGRQFDEINIKRKEMESLESESKSKAARAAKIGLLTPSVQVDEENVNNAKLRAKAAHDELEALNKSHPETGSILGYEYDKGGLYRGPREQRRKDAAEADADLQRALNNQQANSVKRSLVSKLTGQAEAAAGKAATIGSGLNNDIGNNRADLLNKVNEDISAANRTKVGSNGKLNNLQSIGGGFVVENKSVTIANQQLAVLREIRNGILKSSPKAPALNATNFGGVK